MAVPVISAKALSDYSITTEETTYPAATILNSPTHVIMKVNGYAFDLSNTATNTWGKEVWGFEIGTCTNASVYFIATNADGGVQGTAASGLTVASPNHPVPAETRLLNRIQYLIDHEKDWGGNGVLKQCNPCREIFWENQKHNMTKPWLVYRCMSAKVESNSVDDTKSLLNPLIIRFQIFGDLTKSTNPDFFHGIRDEICWMLEQNPSFQLSDSACEVYRYMISDVRYPTFDGSIDGDSIIIDVQFVVPTGS